MPETPGSTGPGESERRTFVAKLAGFRNSLPLREQKMLDALVSAALRTSSPEDRALYWIGPRPSEGPRNTSPT